MLRVRMTALPVVEGRAGKVVDGRGTDGDAGNEGRALLAGRVGTFLFLE